MPYQIKKQPGTNLYYVRAEDGQHLSKEPMSLEKAKKQLTAANIAHAEKKASQK
jgi:hypothetical protein